MTTFVRILKAWFPAAFLATALAGLVYVAVQQSYRQSANDPQVQMAEDAALTIQDGAKTQSLNLSGTVSIEKSLSPYLVFYNDSGTPTGGNGLLHGQFPTLPQGVFDHARAWGENRVTWQPEPDVRSAIVVAYISGPQPGFVMAGRSLREVEYREDRLELLVDIGWIAALLGTLALQAFAMLFKRP
jgi:hypothetical protein